MAASSCVSILFCDCVVALVPCSEVWEEGEGEGEVEVEVEGEDCEVVAL